MSIALYNLNSECSHIVLFTVQIRSLLKSTNDLIDICYDCRSGTRDTLAKESVDFEQASDHLVELHNNLEKLFKAAVTNSAHSLGIGTSVGVVNGLLSRSKDEISKMETMLKQISGRKRIKEPSPSFNPQAILTGLALSTNALRGIVEGNFGCVCNFAKKYNADNVRKGPRAPTGTSASNSAVYINSRCRIER